MTTRPIVGLDELAQWGQPREVAGIVGGPGRMMLAKRLPRSFVGVPPQEDVGEGVLPEIQCDVQREIRPDRLVLAVTSADGLDEDNVLVHDIRVGTISINASQNPLPGSCFMPLAVGSSIRAPVTAIPAIGIQLVLEIIDVGAEESLNVYGAFFGPSAAPNSGLGGPTQEGGNGAVSGIVGADDDGGGDVMTDDAMRLPQSMVGLPGESIGAGLQRYVQVPIQRDMRPDRLMLALSLYSGFLVADIRVGTISINASINPAPGHAFQPLAFGTRLRPPVTASPNVGIGLIVRNIASTPLVLRGGFFGPSRYATA